MTNNLKEKLAQGRVVMGWTVIPSTVITEIISKAGFDAVVIDLEHSAIDLKDVEPLFQITEANGATPLVRLSNNDPILVKRVLDMGAGGIIVPLINSASEAISAIQSAKYPPEGTRSTGIYRAQGYGISFKEYRSSANEHVVVILQIETKTAVDNIDEILKIPGIDAIMIGPYDLSATYGIAGELDHPVMKEATAKIHESAKRHNVKLGTHIVDASTQKLKETLEQGFSFVVYSNDSIILANQYNEAIKAAKN